MSMEQITAKILSDAQAEVRQIEDEITKRVREIKAEERERVEAIRKEAQEDGSRRAEDRQKKDMATAELELRKALLAQKQKLIQQVFDEALKRLYQLKGQEYQRFIAELLLKVVEIGDEEIIFSSAGDHKTDKKLLEEVNGRLVEMGKKGSLRLVEENRDLQGGFILRRGKMEVNCSFDMLFNTLREELEPEVAEILFS